LKGALSVGALELLSEMSIYSCSVDFIDKFFMAIFWQMQVNVTIRWKYMKRSFGGMGPMFTSFNILGGNLVKTFVPFPNAIWFNCMFREACLHIEYLYLA
ncbi:hypothetical protein ACJX0J_021193, partial [Zea mays]